MKNLMNQKTKNSIMGKILKRLNKLVFRNYDTNYGIVIASKDSSIAIIEPIDDEELSFIILYLTKRRILNKKE